MFKLSSPLLFIDSYKGDHLSQYPEGLSFLYSNLTPRKSRVTGVNKVVWFGAQAWIIDILLNDMQEFFFTLKKDKAIEPYRKRMESFYWKGLKAIDAVADLWDLGHNPLLIKTLPEGSLVNIGVPCMTVQSTHEDFAWMVNSWETCLSNMIWEPCTSATTSWIFKQIFEKWAKVTGASKEFIRFQGHDFSMRGMSGLFSAAASGAGHLLSFDGTDTIAALEFIDQYYDGNSIEQFVAGSVPATEHSVMCVGGPGEEFNTIKRLITQVYPKGTRAIVSDTFDLWRVITEYLPQLKEAILNTPPSDNGLPGKLVVRPDSGDPADILCGDPYAPSGSPQFKGVIELLWEIFPGGTTSTGHRKLDPHIGAIYGDSITIAKADEICRRLHEKNFSTDFGPLGIGSYSFRYTTRDTYGFAMKATACEVDGVPMNLFKDPVTDGGKALKKSAKGLLHVNFDPTTKDYTLQQEVSKEMEQTGALIPVFKDDKLLVKYTFQQCRDRLAMHA